MAQRVGVCWGGAGVRGEGDTATAPRAGGPGKGTVTCKPVREGHKGERGLAGMVPRSGVCLCGEMGTWGHRCLWVGAALLQGGVLGGCRGGGNRGGGCLGVSVCAHGGVCAYMCMCLHPCAHACVCTGVYACFCTRMCVCVHQGCACMYMYAQEYVCVCVRAHRSMCVHMHVCARRVHACARTGVCACVFACAPRVCMYVHVHVSGKCMCVHRSVCTHVCARDVHVCVHRSVCVHACMCQAHTCVCIHVCMHVCAQECMHVCVYVHTEGVHVCTCVCQGSACVCACMCTRTFHALVRVHRPHVCPSPSQQGWAPSRDSPTVLGELLSPRARGQCHVPCPVPDPAWSILGQRRAWPRHCGETRDGHGKGTRCGVPTPAPQAPLVPPVGPEGTAGSRRPGT